MKRNVNVNVRLVLSPEEHSRVVAVFTLLVAIDKRLNGKKKKAKKAKTKSKDSKDNLEYIYDHKGSRGGPFLIFNSIAYHNLTNGTKT